MGFRVRPGEDHRGDPALWIELALPLEGKGIPERGLMREVVRFISERQAEILARGVRPWPFFRLVETVG